MGFDKGKYLRLFVRIYGLVDMLRIYEISELITILNLNTVSRSEDFLETISMFIIA